MAIFLARAGSRGQHEDKFLEDGRIYLTWQRLDQDVSGYESRADLRELLKQMYPNAKPGKITQNSGQFWTFLKKMSPGDWVVTPSKRGPFIHIGEIKSECRYNPDAEDMFKHYREVDWFATEIPKSNFDQDLLYSFGAFLTFCEIKRNNAEQRLKAMHANGWRVGSPSRPSARSAGKTSDTNVNSAEVEDAYDLESLLNIEEASRETIASEILAKFKGHGMERLVAAILEAKGYTVYQHSEGVDHGIDLLAAQGALGFDHPKICVQVKSQESPLDRPVLDQLLGTMSHVGAENGLLVCWGGFKSSVMRELPKLFFRVRFWSRDDLIDELLESYDRLGEELQAELPLKKIWTLAVAEDADEDSEE